MADPLWPGDHLAGDHFTEEALFEAVLRVETSWLITLHTLGIAPAEVSELRFDLDRAEFNAEVASTGNPVAPLVAAVRRRLEEDEPAVAPWLHRGLTSQDVLDSALMLMARDAVAEVRTQLELQADLLTTFAGRHRRTRQVGRTLTQPAVPITFGLKAGQWLAGALDAYDDLAALRFPVQIGGAAGTLAAAVEIGVPEPLSVVSAVASSLGLSTSPPWHTNRAPVTRIGDALVSCTDAWGRIAGDTLTLGRPEIGELREGTGGDSSTMPHKANPVLAVLVRRAALAAPAQAATLHLAAADVVDERPDGAWHAEWAPLRDLTRRTLVSAAQTTQLLTGLEVDAERMTANLDAVRDDVHSEQRAMARLAGHQPTGDYLGAADAVIDSILARARGMHA